MAQQAIASRMARLPSESCPLERCVGRTLREDIYPERDNPPFDRVCMDGIAISSAALARGLRRFDIAGTQRAGAPAATLADGDAAIEVMTGSILPHGADCVIPIEEYDLAGSVALLKGEAAGAPYRNVQRRGSESPPGVPMLKAGMRFGAPEIAVAASAGRAKVLVSRQPRLMVVSTGDELIEPGAPIAEHQVRRSNVYALLAALRARGFDSLSNDHLLDSEQMLRERLSLHLSGHDALILSGGMSKGKFDFVPQVLQSLRVAEVFREIAQRPGMPMWFGLGEAGQAVFGLPGNPVSTLVCLIRYVIPALMLAMGAQYAAAEPIALAEPVRFDRPMAYFLPVQVRHDERGCPVAIPRAPQGSGDFLALAGTDGFIELSPHPDGFPAGFVADLYRW